MLGEEGVCPHEAGVAAEGCGDGGDEEQLDAERVEGSGETVEGAGGVVGEPANGVVEAAVLGAVGAEGLEDAHHELDDEEVERGAEERHGDTEGEVVREAGDDGFPVAYADDAGEEEVAGAVHEIEAAEEPKEIAEVGAAGGERGGGHGEGAGDEVDEGAGGVDEAIGADVREVIAGEGGGDVAAEIGGEAVAEAFVEEGGSGDGEDRHADDGEVAVGRVGWDRFWHQAASVADWLVIRGRAGAVVRDANGVDP